MKNNLSFCIKTIGCKSNQFDSALLRERLEIAGLKYDLTKPDIFIVNSCVVTEGAVRDVRKSIRAMRKNNPEVKIILTGCLTGVFDFYRDSEFASADLILGRKETDDILKYIGDTGVKNSGEDITYLKYSGTGKREGSRYFLKIQEGCNQLCGYCIVPFVRGKPKSLPPEDILKWLYDLKIKGAKEVVLTGINLILYGIDLPGDFRLPQLIMLLEKESPLRRIRMSSIEFIKFDEGLLNLLCNSSVIVPHFHIPLQNADDRVLMSMGRFYTFDDYRRVVETFKFKIPYVCIGTDVIVGLPGESYKGFVDSIEKIKGLPIDYIHIFPFSPRPGTKAEKNSPTVSFKEKREMIKILENVDREKRDKFIRQNIGNIRTAIIENIESAPFALTDNFIRVKIKNPVPGLKDGEECNVKILSPAYEKNKKGLVAYGYIQDKRN